MAKYQVIFEGLKLQPFAELIFAKLIENHTHYLVQRLCGCNFAEILKFAKYTPLENNPL